MKFTATILTALLAQQSANAFTVPHGRATVSGSALSVAAAETKVIDDAQIDIKPAISIEEDIEVKQDMKVEEDMVVEEEKIDNSIFDPTKRVQTGRYNDREMSVAIPFLKRPSKLDGSQAGDIGFDPLGFSEQFDLYTMMESEIRHARLAMLAVVGWPLSELVGPKFMLNGEYGTAPSVLNGFNPLSFLLVAIIFGGFGFFEYMTAFRRVNNTKLGKIHEEDMANVWEFGVPGDYNFDPLNLYSMFGDTADARKALRELEISHGRSAMLGITAFAIWEKLTGHPIVENSMFFHPNLFLPILGIAYLGFGFFYEVKNDDQYVFQIEETSEGKVRIGNMQREMEKVEFDTEGAMEALSSFSEMAGEAGKKIQAKYEEMNESLYTDESVSSTTEKKEEEPFFAEKKES